MTPIVHGLYVHPIKGCTATALTTSAVVETGLLHDRDFMLVDAVDGHFISQRKLPAMAVIRPTVVDEGLVVTAPGLEDHEHKTRYDGDRIAVKVHWWDGEGVDQGDEAAEWFTLALGRPCRMVRVPPDLDRRLDDEGRVGFADAHALLMTSLSSLDGLNERILQTGADPVPMNRFRPNVVVSGWPEPHTEDLVREVAIGTASFGYARVCVRCVVPTVDQETGLKAGHEPTRTLAGYRRANGGVTFGMKAKVLRTGTLSVGDPVEVTAWA
ncbi:MOSC domain-containing protein [Umezawaea endophytica]|uniref:MOSC domain-containing protein n=1 Tax=Umezawaea endophytica TaxID=1654476 RepID=A0A9X3A2N7_9PSEU|nr:MOSC N-terminal beta barrel domain-containing protein [Umezawaea endophytica]MCS7480869.1 MOSC domain-containing protein [Umezawaea endophytica]